MMRPNGQSTMVHKGWQVPKSRNFSEGRKPTASHRRLEGGVAVNSSMPTQVFEFVHGSTETKDNDRDIRKFVRAHVVRHTANQNRLRQKTKAKHHQVKKPRLDTRDNTPEDIDIEEIGLVESGTVDTKRRYLENTLTPLMASMKPALYDLVSHLSTVSNAMFPLESRLKFNPISPASWFDFAMSDPALMHALLYTSVSYAGLLSGVTEPHEAVVQRLQSIRLLNKRFNKDEIEDGTIGAVSCLATTDAMCGRFEGWKVHMSGLKQMVDMRGGMMNLNSLLRMKLWRSDLRGAINYLTDPLLQYHDMQPSSTASISHSPEIEDIDSKTLIQLLTSSYIDPNLIINYQNLFHFSHATTHALNLGLSTTTSRAFVESSYQIKYSLLAFSSTKPPHSPAHFLEEALRIGALIYMNEILEELPFSVVGSTHLVQKLKESLEEVRMEGGQRKSGDELVIWLLFIGGISPKCSKDRAWFVARLVRDVERLGLGEWGDVKAVLEGMLWVEEVHGKDCKRLWEEVEITQSILGGG